MRVVAVRRLVVDPGQMAVLHRSRPDFQDLRAQKAADRQQREDRLRMPELREQLGDKVRTIHVVAAIIRNNNLIFATQRGYGDWKDYWEFPGGKIEPGETPQEDLVREIKEELTADIEVGELIDTVEYDYPGFHLSMDCYWCTLKSGELTLLEAEAAKWLSYDDLYIVDWLPADEELVKKLKQA